MSPKRVVITGGPGTGKTSLVNSLEEAGFICYHEIIRDLTSEAIDGNDPSQFATNPLAFVEDPFSFNEKILHGRLLQYQKASSADGNIVFFDRGMPDVLAYMDYFDQKYGDDFNNPCHNYRYDEVIILPPWKGIYTSDGERFESYEEASAIHVELVNKYEYFNYSPVQIPIGTVEERQMFVIDLLKSLT